MPPFEPLRASRPRRLRQSPAPKTPEPTNEGQVQPPSPPRLRFRLRRRTASELNAPTSQFLASVAAADIPIPSIEEPQVYDDEDMLSIDYPVITTLDRIDDVALSAQSSRGRAFSPPKTPAPGLAPSLSPKQFPDWSIDSAFSSLESTPEYESSRPSTARSTQTSSSLFSQSSFTSEDFLSQCVSPESEHNERFGHFLAPDDAAKTIKPSVPSTKSAKSRRAPWTKAMSQHLWSTYMTYLQDPKVTPFRVGKSGIPPSGVCMRVAREAKRSWKGSRTTTKPDHKSGSSTPTAEFSSPYILWPHTCAATRGHLRELCKAHNASTTRHIQYLSNSPTPFGKTVNRFWSRRSVPARSPSVFSGSDMAMSLTVSTADSMQRQGPLAQLTSSQFELPAKSPSTEQPVFNFGGNLEQSRPRLGSPFMARSYGPSSSSGLVGGLNESPEIQRQARTVGTRRGLGSPVRLDQSRTSTQKRRSRQSVLEPRRIKRPSLGSDFWTDPSGNGNAETEAHFVEYSSTDSNQRDNLFVPRTNLQELFEASNPAPSLAGSASFRPTATALPSSQTVPARLGSPFSAKATSHSFPNRHSRVSSIDIGAVLRPFATVHQLGEKSNNAATTATSAKTPLVNRLAYIDERLKDFRHRGRNSRRSQSPF
ncbi:hypothetical protein QQS21_006395 [Conoideocrella luteorostrata]|uniref:Uncharacterized protein n=1 Tax=Conoideocrella luteorostrata TaxID=1105319 RepID=A0AAJ0CNN7_9HYPO|nr:hypothetical protein QQS21_006395 [Conoideocrella luteorostrata]